MKKVYKAPHIILVIGSIGDIKRVIVMTSELLFCVGTRPELIKLAPLVIAAKEQLGQHSVRLLDTGQHNPSVLDPLYDFFRITPDLRLETYRKGGTLTALNARLLEQIGDEISATSPRIVVVQGDTATALQGALAGFLAGVNVAHVEAGLRSNNLYQPFPEEMNRSVIARLANWHFAPTHVAAQALKREAVPGYIEVVGNSIVDAVRLVLPRLPRPLAGERTPREQRNLVVTMHRRENWGEGVRRVATAVARALNSDLALVCQWVLHPNPNVADTVEAVFRALTPDVRSRITLLAPQPYPEMLTILQESHILLTDSGGIQEEAICLGLPILVAREETERPEVIETGWGRLVGTNSELIFTELTTQSRWQREVQEGLANPLGDGYTSQAIMKTLAAALA